MHFLRRQQRKSFRKVESHLIAENALRSDPGPVVLHHPIFPDMSQKFKILFHLQKKVLSNLATQQLATKMQRFQNQIKG